MAIQKDTYASVKIHPATTENLKKLNITQRENTTLLLLDVTHGNITTGESCQRFIPLLTHNPSGKKIVFDATLIQKYISQHSVLDKSHTIGLLEGASKQNQSFSVHVKTDAGDFSFAIWPNGTVELKQKPKQHRCAKLDVSVETPANIRTNEPLHFRSLHLDADTIRLDHTCKAQEIIMNAKQGCDIFSAITADYLKVNGFNFHLDKNAVLDIKRHFQLVCQNAYTHGLVKNANKTIINAKIIKQFGEWKLATVEVFASDEFENLHIINADNFDLKNSPLFVNRNQAKIDIKEKFAFDGKILLQLGKLKSKIVDVQVSEQGINENLIEAYQFNIKNSALFHNKKGATIDVSFLLDIKDCESGVNDGTIESLAMTGETVDFKNGKTGRLIIEEETNLTIKGNGINEGKFSSKKSSIQGGKFNNHKGGKIETEIKLDLILKKCILDGFVASRTGEMDFKISEDFHQLPDAYIEAAKEIRIKSKRYQQEGTFSSGVRIIVDSQTNAFFAPTAQSLAPIVAVSAVEKIYHAGKTGQFAENVKITNIAFIAKAIENSGVLLGRIHFTLTDLKQGYIKNLTTGLISFGEIKALFEIKAPLFANHGQLDVYDISVEAPPMPDDRITFDNEEGNINVKNKCQLKGHVSNYRGKLDCQIMDLLSTYDFDNRYGQVRSKTGTIEFKRYLKNQSGFIYFDVKIDIKSLQAFFDKNKKQRYETNENSRIDCTSRGMIYSPGLLSARAGHILVDDESSMKGELGTDLVANKITTFTPLVSKKITIKSNSSHLQGVAAEEDLSWTQKQTELWLQYRVEAKTATLTAPEIGNNAVLKITDKLDLKTTATHIPYSFTNQRKIIGNAKVTFSGHGFSHIKEYIKAFSLDITTLNSQVIASIETMDFLIFHHQGGEWIFDNKVTVGGKLGFHWHEGRVIDQTYQASELMFTLPHTAKMRLVFMVDQNAVLGNLDIHIPTPIQIGTPKNYVTLEAGKKLNIAASDFEMPAGRLIAQQGGIIKIPGLINIHASTATEQLNVLTPESFHKTIANPNLHPNPLWRRLLGQSESLDIITMPSGKKQDDNEYVNGIFSGGDLTIETEKPFTTQGMELYVHEDFLFKAPKLDLTGDCAWTLASNAMLDVPKIEFRSLRFEHAGKQQFKLSDWGNCHNAYGTAFACSKALTGPNTIQVGKKLITTGTTSIIGSQVYYVESFEGIMPHIEHIMQYFLYELYFRCGNRKERKAKDFYVPYKIYGNTLSGTFSIGGDIKIPGGILAISGNVTAGGIVDLTMVEDGLIGLKKEVKIKLPPPKKFTSKVPLINFMKRTAMHVIVEEVHPTIFKSLLSIPIENDLGPVVVLDASGALRFNTKNLPYLFNALQDRQLIVRAFLESLGRGFLSEKITKPAEILKTLKENAEKYLRSGDTMALAKGVESIKEPMILFEEMEFTFASGAKKWCLVPTLYLPREMMDIQILSGAGCLMSYSNEINITGNKAVYSRVLLTGFIKAKKLTIDVNEPHFERRTTTQKIKVIDETISRSLMGKKKKQTEREFEVEVPEPGAGIITKEGVLIKNADHWHMSSVDIDAGEGDTETENVKVITEEAIVGGVVERSRDKLRNPLGSVTTIAHELQPIVYPSRLKGRRVKLISEIGAYGAIEIQAKEVEVKGETFLEFNFLRKRIAENKASRIKEKEESKRKAKKKQKRQTALMIASTAAGVGAGYWAAAQYAASAAAAASASAAATTATTVGASAAAVKTAATIAFKAAIIKAATSSATIALLTKKNPVTAAAKGALFAGIGHQVGSAFSEVENTRIKDGMPIAATAAARAIVDRTPIVEGIVSSVVSHAIADTVLPKESNEVIQTAAKEIQSSMLHGLIVDSVGAAVRGLSIKEILQAGVMGAIYSLANKAGEALAKTALEKESQAQKTQEESEIKESALEEATIVIAKELENEDISVPEEVIRETLESHEALQGSLEEMQEKLIELGDPRGKTTNRKDAIKQGFNKVLMATLNKLFPAAYASEANWSSDNEKDNTLRPIYSLEKDDNFRGMIAPIKKQIENFIEDEEIIFLGTSAIRVKLPFLYRGDNNGNAFQNGFKSRGNNLDLVNHISPGDYFAVNSGYVSTSTSKKRAIIYPLENTQDSSKFLYEINPHANGIDVDKFWHLATSSRKWKKTDYVPPDKEIAIPSKIERQNIKGAWPVRVIRNRVKSEYKIESFIPNPNWIPPVKFCVANPTKNNEGIFSKSPEYHAEKIYQKIQESVGVCSTDAMLLHALLKVWNASDIEVHSKAISFRVKETPKIPQHTMRSEFCKQYPLHRGQNGRMWIDTFTRDSACEEMKKPALYQAIRLTVGRTDAIDIINALESWKATEIQVYPETISFRAEKSNLSAFKLNEVSPSCKTYPLKKGADGKMIIDIESVSTSCLKEKTAVSAKFEFTSNLDERVQHSARRAAKTLPIRKALAKMDEAIPGIHRYVGKKLTYGGTVLDYSRRHEDSLENGNSVTAAKVCSGFGAGAQTTFRVGGYSVLASTAATSTIGSGGAGLLPAIGYWGAGAFFVENAAEFGGDLAQRGCENVFRWQWPQRWFNNTLNFLVPKAHAEMRQQASYEQDISLAVSERRLSNEARYHSQIKKYDALRLEHCEELAERTQKNFRVAGYAGLYIAASGAIVLTLGADTVPVAASVVMFSGMLEVIAKKAADDTRATCLQESGTNSTTVTTLYDHARKQKDSKVEREDWSIRHYQKRRNG